LAREENRDAYLFLLPQLLGLAALLIGPLIVSAYYTLTKWDLIAPRPTWIGLRNWTHLLLRDSRMTQVIWNTLRFVVTATPVYLVLALATALLVHHKRVRGRPLIQGLFFLPWTMSQVAVGTTWVWMLNARSGPIAQFLKLFGVASPLWLQDPRYAMSAVAMATVWQALGYGMTIYLAGLRGISEDLFEAATVDGASAFQRFWYVTLPSISPVTFFLLVTSLIAAFQLYDPVVAMTSPGPLRPAGGPQGSTMTIVLYLTLHMFYYSETLSGLGYAATIGWVLALLVFGVTLVQWRLARSWVFYSGGMIGRRDAHLPAGRRLAGANVWLSRALRERVTLIAYHVFVALVLAVHLAPVLWAVSTSFRTNANLYNPTQWIPSPATTEHYQNLFALLPMFWRYTANTLRIAALSTIGQVLSCSMAGYALARLRFTGRRTILMVLMLTMMVPAQVTLIPQYVLFRSLGWINTPLPLIIPAFFGGAYGSFFFRQFFMSIPRDVEDAAFVDGATRWHVYGRIVLPMSKPALTTLGLLSFAGAWNSLFGPNIYLHKQTEWVITQGLVSLSTEWVSRWGEVSAGIVLMSLPMAVLYILGQRYFSEGITFTGVKG
jgi:ABC-type sugar transport system permease subunit